MIFSMLHLWTESIVENANSPFCHTYKTVGNTGNFPSYLESAWAPTKNPIRGIIFFFLFIYREFFLSKNNICLLLALLSSRVTQNVCQEKSDYFKWQFFFFFAHLSETVTGSIRLLWSLIYLLASISLFSWQYKLLECREWQFTY